MSADPEPVPPSTAGAPGRSAARDPPRHRRSAPASSARSVEALRGRVTELTDWRRQVREHRSQLIVGAAVVGFAIGGLRCSAPPPLAELEAEHVGR